MSQQLTVDPQQHVNPYEAAVREHVPAVGDYYADRTPSCNGACVLRLESSEQTQYGVRWTVTAVLGSRHTDSIGEKELKQYYRPILGNWDEIRRVATRLADGEDVEDIISPIAGGMKAGADSEAVLASESPEHIAMVLDDAERRAAALTEIRHTAKVMIEIRKNELDRQMRKMEEAVKAMEEKVSNILKVITVLNIYTGKTVDIHQIVVGQPAPDGTPVSLRQCFVYMDEELCIHLDHEADYSDAGVFFEWLKEEKNRDIVLPELRCVVAVKPKRFNMEYRSGDAAYDHARNLWNKHTYIVIRNGENLWWLESDDMELFEWAFPPSDYIASLEKGMAESWEGSISYQEFRHKHESVSYRTTKYLMFLQGLADQQTLFAPCSRRLNFLKGEGVEFVRDMENIIGTGRLPWAEFVREKNKSIRHGSRIVYVAGATYREGAGRPLESSSGSFYRYYANAYSRPDFPTTGIYNAEDARVFDYRKRDSVMSPTTFLYLPGDKVFYRDECDWEGHDRKRRERWIFEKSAVLNYDAITLDELNGYLEDRSLRDQFAAMIPMLVAVRKIKVEELRQEAAFRQLLQADFLKKEGLGVRDETVDEAIAWWKEKVIFSRPLRSDDGKAWRMIRSRILSQFKEKPNHKIQ